MQIDFRYADKSDIESVFAMFCKSVEDYEDLKTKDFERIKAWETNKLQKYISQYYCILCEGEKAGYVRFYQNGNRMEIDDFYIFPEFRNKGIGTETLRRLKKATDKPIFLYVLKKNEKAIRLYNREGFLFKEEVDETRMILEYSREDV